MTIVVKCVYRATSVTIKVTAKDDEEALAKAARNQFGKRALSYVIVGRRP